MYQNPSDRSPQQPADAHARVLVVGVGALGCPAARLLIAAGATGAANDDPVSLLTLVDPDRIELSNLQRQPLFDDADIGSFKATVAAEKLRAGNTCRIEALCEAFDDDNAETLVGAHDYVIDATDSPRAKFLINDTAARLGVAFSYGGVVRTGGQAMAVVPGKTACLRCVFPEGVDDGEAGSCSEMGILAPVAGVIGSLQAAHALGYISGRPFEGGAMTIYNLRGERIRRVAFRRRKQCAGCSSPDESRIAKQSQDSRRSCSPQSASAPLAGATDTDVAGADLRRQTTCHS